MLDEPTSGLDPVVRRDFIRTVIGAYQESDPGNRTILVSTHLITEFEGLIDEFTIIEQGRSVLTLAADAARERFQKVYARFPGPLPALDLAGTKVTRRNGCELEFVTLDHPQSVLSRLRSQSPDKVESHGLSLEEIFVTTVQDHSR